MPEYKVTIDGYESGLTARTVRFMFQEMYDNQDLTVTVRESEQE